MEAWSYKECGSWQLAVGSDSGSGMQEGSSKVMLKMWRGKLASFRDGGTNAGHLGVHDKALLRWRLLINPNKLLIIWVTNYLGSNLSRTE